MIKLAIIKKLPSGKYRLYSKKKNKDNKRKNLGTYDSLKAAKEREKQIFFFKSKWQHADDTAYDKETEALEAVSKAAQYLEAAGYIDKANVLYDVMNAIDAGWEDDAADFIPDMQANPGNQGYMGGDGVGGSYSLLSAMATLQHLVKIANSLDEKGLYGYADEIDEVSNSFCKTMTYYQENNGEPNITVSHTSANNGKQSSTEEVFDDIEEAMEYFKNLNENNNIDALVMNTGKFNMTSLDNQSSGQFQGWSSIPQPNYGELEAPYKSEYR